MVAALAEKAKFLERVEACRKIAAVKEPCGIEKAIRHKDKISAVFLMTGNIMSVKNYADLFRKEGLPVFIHIEKIGGLSLNSEGLDFIADYVKPLGIVTTKPGLAAKAKKRRLMVIQRVFMIDSEVYDHVLELGGPDGPDMIEIMPSRLPHIIQSLSEKLLVPVITGGLLTEREHAEESLSCGAAAVTTSNTGIWKEDLSRNGRKNARMPV
ncbi:glycerol-3-phosphate responsive antiterminator [Bacillus sp. UMB0728]|uniref:glycerol-3-phosphate responsive antiterminator n=1 Tax=Bacillus sp. UMB0728 TaxID=2066052 RepID=UPI000C76BE6C|nr:glycerol-3-phosphate responsive antiterminator [Bacillus sp. UMB0728]PLR71282.1 glycerol-3-phosphate responsive antiterminator [Bacillus sp. UMB0728]